MRSARSSRRAPPTGVPGCRHTGMSQWASGLLTRPAVFAHDGRVFMAWLVLVVSGLFETVWATALAASDGFRRPVPVLVFALGSIVSLGGLAYALRTIPVGTGYAVWTGVGAVCTAIYGIAVLGEPATAARIVCLGLIVSGIVGLKVLH